MQTLCQDEVHDSLDTVAPPRVVSEAKGIEVWRTVESCDIAFLDDLVGLHKFMAGHKELALWISFTCRPHVHSHTLILSDQQVYDGVVFALVSCDRSPGSMHRRPVLEHWTILEASMSDMPGAHCFLSSSKVPAEEDSEK